MGCGCKKQGNQAQTNQTVKTVQEQQTTNVQDSVKKIVEKYYNKK